MTGPSAIGSEKGTPTSITSAPASSSPRRRSSDSAMPGCPAVTYTTSARRPAARSSANWRSSASGEVVADADTIPLGIGKLDDGAEEAPGSVLLVEVGERAGVQQVAPLVADHADDGARDRLGDRVHGVHDRELERIEHDQRAHGVMAHEADERLHDYRIHPAA